MRTLVSFSGGLDSTYTLWWLLKNTNDDVTALFLDESYLTESYLTSRGVVNAPYIPNLVSELQKIRTFEFKTVNAYEFGPDETKEVWILRYIAPKINDGTYDKVTFGTGDVGSRLENSTPAFDRIPRGYIALQREFAKIANRGEIYFHYLKYNETRVHATINLPDNVKSLILACSGPQIQSDGTLVRCGTCNKCVQDAVIESSLAAKKTIEETISAFVAARYVSDGRKKFLNVGGIWSPSEP
jgi:hypothetical protein